MMERHSDPFFESVRSELYTMEVAPPEHTFGAIQKRINGKSGYAFNTMVAVLLIGAILAGTWFMTNEEQAEATAFNTPEITLDAALSTGNQRIQERDQVMDRETYSQSKVNQFSTPATAISYTSSTQEIVPHEVRASTESVESIEQSDYNAATSEESFKSEASKTADVNDDAKSAAVTMPGNWTNNVGNVNASEILDQAGSEQEVIRISIPVKVQVEDKD
jgi:hypothetical protein